MKLAGGILILAALFLVPTLASADGSLAQGYARVKPALVKVWAFNKAGVPIESGTGFVVRSDARRSWIVTAQHVVARSARVTVHVNRTLHDLRASVIAKTSEHQDIALLQIARGNLPTVVEFAPRGKLWRKR